MWDKAEAALTDALNSTGRAWSLNEADGAFYGPKIDITVFDALKRRFQCATVQLDFQLPIRFGLQYMTEDPAVTERPVIVHRAILGSVERMFAILTEHYGGKWPLWLSPRQAAVVPISEASLPYAQEVRAALRARGLHCEVDGTSSKMQKKVRDAQLQQVNYILVVGEQERDARLVNVRTRDNVVHGMFALADVAGIMAEERDARALGSIFAEKAHLKVAGGGGDKAEKGKASSGGGAAAAAADGAAA
jgi:threonyl-tRNA synthetase